MQINPQKPYKFQFYCFSLFNIKNLVALRRLWTLLLDSPGSRLLFFVPRLCLRTPTFSEPVNLEVGAFQVRVLLDRSLLTVDHVSSIARSYYYQIWPRLSNEFIFLYFLSIRLNFTTRFNHVLHSIMTYPTMKAPSHRYKRDSRPSRSLYSPSLIYNP